MDAAGEASGFCAVVGWSALGSGATFEAALCGGDEGEAVGIGDGEGKRATAGVI
jgi:hypothetical protein